MSRKSFKIALTGNKGLDRTLQQIAADEGSKSINKEMRGATREAIKQYVEPEVKDYVPYETGFLESQITVKSIGRSRTKMGTAIGFKEKDLFRGDTFYAGFHEYGWINRGGTAVPGDPFLRGPLYRNEGRVKRFILDRMLGWLRKRNKR